MEIHQDLHVLLKLSLDEKSITCKLIIGMNHYMLALCYLPFYKLYIKEQILEQMDHLYYSGHLPIKKIYVFSILIFKCYILTSQKYIVVKKMETKNCIY